jgi:hypothetical protein
MQGFKCAAGATRHAGKILLPQVILAGEADISTAGD